MTQKIFNNLTKCILLTFIVIPFAFVSCKKEGKKEQNTNTREQGITYSYDDGSVKQEIKITKTPVRAAAFSQFMTETLLSLGLNDGRIVLGTTEGKILPKLQKDFDKINTKLHGHHYPITREAFLLLNPDFVTGWDGTITPEKTGSVEELLKNGIYPYSVKSTKDGATLDTVFEEILTLGKIFDVEENAQNLVKGFKDKLEKAELKEAPNGKKINAVIMGALDNGAYVCGSLATDLINRANGVNSFKELKGDFELVSYEALVDRNPDIIFLQEYSEFPIEERINFIKNHPLLKGVKAIKNNNVHTVLLSDIAPGVRNVDLIIKMNSLFYK